MYSEQHIWGLVKLSIVFALVASLYGLASLWVLYGSKNWLLRWAPLLLLLSALVPIGAFPLVLLYGAQAGTIIAVIKLQRFITARQRARQVSNSDVALAHGLGATVRGSPERIRFTLSDALQTLALVGALLAISRLAPAEDYSFLESPTELLSVCAAGCALGAVCLAVLSVVLCKSWRGTRIVILFLVVAGASMVLSYAGGPLPWMQWEGSRLMLVVDFVHPACLAGLFGLLVRLASVSGLWVPARGGSARTRLAQLELVTFGIVGTATLIYVYGAWLPPSLPDTSLPVPNGYDELIAAAQSLDWSMIPDTDDEAATLSEAKAFVAANQRQLTQARAALSKPCQVTDWWLPQSPMTHPYPALRTLCRGMMLESRTASQSGQHFEAARIDLQVVQLANALSHGGLILDDLVAGAVASVGLSDLANQIPHLSASELDAVRKSADSPFLSRDPFEEFQARDRLHHAIAYGWLGRIWYGAGFDLTDPDLLRSARNRSIAEFQLALGEVAIRQHVLTEGLPPESLESLVPKYLSTVPKDPYGDGPLVYRRQGNGHLLYSVGRNGIDDGGRRIPFNDADYGSKGDLFLDQNKTAPTPPAESDAGSASADEFK